LKGPIWALDDVAMKRFLFVSALCCAGALAAIHYTLPTRSLVEVRDGTKPREAKERQELSSLKVYGTDAAWKAALARMEKEAGVTDAAASATDASAPPQDAPPPIVKSESPPLSAEREITPATNPEITSNQNVGVDEGGIVKQIGPYLLVLQDGRIFAVDTKTGLRLSDRMNVYTQNEENGAWYDEMLVQEDRIIVTSYSYRHSATTMSVFKIAMESGKLTREGVFYLSSQDYYSTSNYATRIVGNKLVLRITSPISARFDDPEGTSIGMLQDDMRQAKRQRQPLISLRNLYMPVLEGPTSRVHSVVICPLKSGLPENSGCQTKSFVGPSESTLLVTTTDAYLWNGGGYYESYAYGDNLTRRRSLQECTRRGVDILANAQDSVVYRVPLDGATPTFARTKARPADQFQMEVQNEHFYMLSRYANNQCGDGGPATLFLTKLSLSQFRTEPGELPTRAITALPGGTFQDPITRFSDGWMVYFGGADVFAQYSPSENDRAQSRLYATPLATPDATKTATLPHSLIRLQPVGGGMLATGTQTGRDLAVSWLSLDSGFQARSSLTLEGRVESEGRSHAFSAAGLDGGRTLMGLPTMAFNDGSIREISRTNLSDISFFSLSANGQLSRAGKIQMSETKPSNGYTCEVSCVDWYGNSRAIFTGGRIFALMGTQIVEGRLNGPKMDTIARLNMTAPVGTGRS
jgi:hypothetical protein